MKTSPSKTKGREATPTTPAFSWLNPKCQVRETEKCGKGILAVEPLKKEEIVLIAGGYVLTTEDEKWFSGDMADKPIEIHQEFYIGPRTDQEVMLTHQSYLNHSCNPNIGVKGQIIYVAIKDIKAKEEICIDYAMILASSRISVLTVEFPCLCGTINCRGKVTEDDWMLQKLQRRYKGYFSWYIQEKIDKRRRRK